VQGSEESRPQVGILLMKKPVRLFHIIVGIYINILGFIRQRADYDSNRKKRLRHFTCPKFSLIHTCDPRQSSFRNLYLSSDRHDRYCHLQLEPSVDLSDISQVFGICAPFGFTRDKIHIFLDKKYLPVLFFTQ